MTTNTHSNLMTPSTTRAFSRSGASNILTALGALTMVAWPSLVLLNIHSSLTAAVSLLAWSSVAVIPYLQLQRNILPWLLTAWAGAATLALTGWGSWRFSLYGAPVATQALAWLLYFPTAGVHLRRLGDGLVSLLGGFLTFLGQFLQLFIPVAAILAATLSFGLLTLPHMIHNLGDMMFWGYFILLMTIPLMPASRPSYYY